RIDIKPELLDLRRFYNKTPESLLKKLQQYDLIWVRGGNTFLLRYVMKKSGFDAVIKDALKNGLVYAGESAGALVMGPTLKYIDIVDDPNVVPEMIWRGIDFVDTVPLPHWGAKKYGNTIKKTYLALRKDGVKVAKFSDGEAMLVKDKNWEKVRTNRYWR
ncbi:Type 1 glutamine amidotransferase-like domain-containing protein, partial [Patescibacteria group bacterium]|nr:Type 1 glutamine amidotransferase-like domain-containing protein [Patescibacteria group bacterium]